MLGRTVEELDKGSGAFLPLSAMEMLEWEAFFQLRAASK
jgi:hypothetical protein